MKGVYFVLDSIAGLCKVGISVDVNRRFKQLVRGTNNDLTLLGVLQDCNVQHEKLLHKILTQQGFHVRLEWFEANSEFVECIKDFVHHHNKCINTEQTNPWRTYYNDLSWFETQARRSFNSKPLDKSNIFLDNTKS